MADREPLLASLGVRVADELLTLALTHRSYAYEHGGLPTNERLEFLGDSVLSIVVTERLYREHPDLPEGQLAKLRASVVNMHALAGVAVALGDDGLGAHLYLGRGEELTGGRKKASILADATEALIGAVYLEHGLEVARGLVHRLFGGLLLSAPQLGAGLDWKTSLQELTAAGSLGVPEYRIAEDGPDHLKMFTATAVIGGPGARLRRGAHEEGSRAEGGRARLARPVRRGRRGVGLTEPPAVPELPEVEVVRRGLAEHVVDRPIDRVDVAHPRAVRRHPPGELDFAARLTGRTVTGVRRRGKYLWLDLDAAGQGDDAVLAHLGMSGQMLVADPGRPDEKHLRIRLPLRRRRAGAAFRRPAHVRRHVAASAGAGRGWPRPAPAADRAHCPGPAWTRRSTSTGRWPRCAADGPG